MKPIKKMTQAELAAYVHDHLRKSGIEVVLSGGAAVGIYSSGEYVSRDIDLVNARFAGVGKIEKAMAEIGFTAIGRHYEHPETDHIVEFPPGPLHFGDGRAAEVQEMKFRTGTLRIISPTDCIKDRLAHYYHWGDRQCLQQAILVASRHMIDLNVIQSWSRAEGKLDEYEKIKGNLQGK